MLKFSFIGLMLFLIGACETKPGAETQNFGASDSTPDSADLLEEVKKLNFPLIDPEMMPNEEVLNQAKDFPSRDARVLSYALKDGTEVVLKKPRNGISLNIEARNLYHLQSTGAVPRLFGVKKDQKGNIIEIHMEQGRMDLLNVIEEEASLDEAEVEKFVDKFHLIKEVLDQLGFKYKDMRPDNLVQMNDGSIKAIDFEEMVSQKRNPGTFAQLTAKSLLQALLRKEISQGERGPSDEYIKYAFYLKYRDVKPELTIEKLKELGDIYKFITRREMISDMKNIKEKDCINTVNAKLLQEGLDQYIDYSNIRHDLKFVGCFQDFVVAPDYRSLTIAELLKMEDGIFQAALDSAPKTQISASLKDKLRKLYQDDTDQALTR